MFGLMMLADTMYGSYFADRGINIPIQSGLPGDVINMPELGGVTSH